MTRAEIATSTGDHATAIKLYRRIIDEESYLIAEALPKLVAIFTESGDTQTLERDIESMIESHPNLKAEIAYTAIANDIGGVSIIDRCVENYMLNDPTLADFIDLHQVDSEASQSRSEAYAKVRSALSKLAAATPRYQCRECGFSSKTLLWQCPSCKNWETQRPRSQVKFDSLLQRGSVGS